MNKSYTSLSRKLIFKAWVIKTFCELCRIFRDQTEQSLFHADVLEISPADNNGTHGSMNNILWQPSYAPQPPTEQSAPAQCPLVSLHPSDSLGCSCPALVGIVPLSFIVMLFT